MDMSVSKEWLLRMAEKEGNGITSVGGLMPPELTPTAAIIRCTAIGPYHGDRCDNGRITSPNAQFTRECPVCGGTGEEPLSRCRRLEARIRDLEAALRSLLWPNVPSADDLAILVAMSSGGAEERHNAAMTLVDALRTAQTHAESLLSRKDVTP